MIRKIWTFLGSRNPAIVLLVCLAAFLIVGSFFPDPSLLNEEGLAALRQKSPLLLKISESLRLRSITGSPYFLILPALLFLSILSRTSGRVISHLRTLKGAAATARPWNPRFWGSITFHIGLLVIITGISLSMAFGFSGGIILTEGHTLPLTESDGFSTIERKPISMSALPRFTVSLHNFSAVYEKDRFPVGFRARLAIEDQGLNYTTELLEVNRSITAGGYRFTLQRYGFAPHFTVRNGGRVIFDGDVNLVVFSEDQEDRFEIPETGYVVNTRFFPDYYVKNGRPVSRSVVPRNPVFLLSVFEGNTPVCKGLVSLGKELTGGPVTIAFTGLRHWIYVGMTRDPGMPVIIAGFMLGSLGLFLRFYLPFPRKMG